jgi:hypothetical protein
VHGLLVAHELLLELPKLVRREHRQMVLDDLAGALPRGTAFRARLQLEYQTFLKVAGADAGRL